MRSPDGHDMYSTWAYRHVVPGERRDVRHVVTLEPEGDRTRLTVTEYGYTSKAMLDLSRVGLEQCLDKMAALFVGA